MAIKYSVDIRNARLDAVESVIGASPLLRIRTGAPPADLTAAASGTLLAEVQLPADWMNAAANGSKTKAGTWQDGAADAAGNAGHFEIVTAGGARKVQGTITITGGGGDMELDNINLAVGQVFTVNTFTLNAGNG